MPTYYSPGAVGNSDYIRITAASRLQWVGIPKAPKEFLGLADSPFKVFGKRIGAGVKITAYEELLQRYGLKDEEVMFVGDDIPDLQVMKRVGCACCPKDACDDVKSVSTYISNRIGGHGVGRDVIEQVLRAQGKWLSDEAAFGW